MNRLNYEKKETESNGVKKAIMKNDKKGHEIFVYLQI